MVGHPVFERKILKELEDWFNSGMRECIVLEGARQVGKSFAIERFLDSRFESHITLDFSLNPSLKGIFDGDLDVDGIIRKMKTHFTGFDPVPGKTAIFLDEIQACPNARTSLKSFSLDGRYAVISSGSLLGINYSKVPSYPVGYEHHLNLRSLDFEEFLWAMGIDGETIAYIRGCISSKSSIDRFILDKFNEYFRIFMTVGGMPAAVKSYLENRDIADARITHRNILSGYRNDIGKYSDERERNKIFACFDSIPLQLSKENKKFVYSDIKEAESPSARKYRSSIDWIEDAGIGTLCTNLSEPKMPFEERGNGSAFKLYMNDTGLLLSMMGDDVAHAAIKGDMRVNKGALAENAVAECLSKCGIDLHYFSKKNLAIDFIVPMGGEVVAIEVKSGNNRRSKSLDSIKENYGVKRRMKFEDSDVKVTSDGVEHYPLFAAAFADSMFEKYSLRADPGDAGDVNSRVKGLRR